jgi:uncharacterized Zn finger protein (UPF0148 family)
MRSFIGSFGVLLLLLAASLICAQDTSGKSYVMVIVNKPMTCNLVNLMNPPIEEITANLKSWPGKAPDDNMPWIAFINCDSGPDFFLPNALSAEKNNTSAVVLYPASSNPCSINDNQLQYNINIPLFTATDPSCYKGAQDILENPNIQVSASIRFGPPPPPPSPPKSNSPSDNKVLATYQTAMIVLYAVSGVVLGLFFIVVITNIIKNRINAPVPSSNQSQDPNARPRRGIARSVLESFPVFFFTMGMKDEGDDKKDLETGKAKELESDVELETINSDVMKSAPQAEETKDKEISSDIPKNTDNTSETNDNNNTDNNSSTSSEESNPDLPKNPLVANLKDSSHPTSIDSNHSANNNVQDGQLTCPICLDDFESGEELRLLPCQHRYHTTCIDQWLLDISPLCPMCKTDYTSWESDVNATQHIQDPSGSSSSVESTGNNDYTTNNVNQQNDGDNSPIAPIPHTFPHFRWIKYLKAIRSRSRRNRDRRSSRQSSNNNNNNNWLSQQNNSVVGSVITG